MNIKTLVLAVLPILFGTATAAAAGAAPPRIPTQPPGIAPRAPGLGVDALDTRQQSTLATLQRLSAGALTARFVDGQPKFLHGPIAVSGDDAVSRARSFLSLYGESLWRLGPNSELRLLRTDPVTGLASFAQRYRGLPVLGAQINVFTDRQGVYAVLGALLPADGLDVIPTLDARAVLALVELHGGRLLAPPQLAVSYLPPRVERSGEGIPPREARLVWIIPCVKDGHAHTLIYAADTGEVLRELPLEMDSAAAYDEYEAEWFDANQDHSDYCQGDADNVVEAGNDDGLFSNYQSLPEYVMGWTHGRRAYAFYYDFFGRLSYDGSDGPVLGYHESPDTTNAFWSQACEEINWAPGYGSSDTPVHELSHGVTQFTSALVYQDESGALNESFSDVMAAIADDVGDGRWLNGEDNVNGNGPNRSLENPDRDHYSEFNIDADDNGGVHRNSGIGNKAAYLLAEGGVHPQSGYPVSGIGVTKTGWLIYAAHTNLSEYGDYDDLRNLAYLIAQLWAGAGIHGFTAQDVCSVRNAYAAVGVDGQPNAGTVLGGDADCDGTEDADSPDDDGDGVADYDDVCQFVPDPAQSDSDGDSDAPPYQGGDACDADDDNDSVPDGTDNCPTVANADQAEDPIDSDTIGDACDDSDGDSVPDATDNCPGDYNPSQADSGGDPEMGDACDPDSDGDGVFNSQFDNCPLVPNTDQADSDGDFYGDACDGCPDEADSTPAFGLDMQPYEPDSDGDGTPDQCDSSLDIGGGRGEAADGLPLGARPQFGSFAFFDLLPRVTLPLAICPPPCAEAASAALVGDEFALDLADLPDGVTAMITDAGGRAWSRSQGLGDGVQRLRFQPQGDRGYFLTLLGSAGAPAEGSFTVRSFSTVTPPLAPADLAVTIKVTAGQREQVAYSIVSNNLGYAPVADTQLDVTLPSDARLLSAGGCTAEGSVLHCALGSLDGGAHVSRRVALQATAGGTPVVQAQLSAPAPDPRPANNSASTGR